MHGRLAFEWLSFSGDVYFAFMTKKRVSRPLIFIAIWNNKISTSLLGEIMVPPWFALGFRVFRQTPCFPSDPVFSAIPRVFHNTGPHTLGPRTPQNPASCFPLSRYRQRGLRTDFLTWTGLRLSVPKGLRSCELLSETDSFNFKHNNIQFDVYRAKCKHFYELLIPAEAKLANMTKKLISASIFSLFNSWNTLKKRLGELGRRKKDVSVSVSQLPPGIMI